MILNNKQQLFAKWFYRIAVYNDGLFVLDAETGDEQEETWSIGSRRRISLAEAERVAKLLFSAHDANPAFRAFHYSWILCRICELLQHHLAASVTSTGTALLDQIFFAFSFLIRSRSTRTPCWICYWVYSQLFIVWGSMAIAFIKMYNFKCVLFLNTIVNCLCRETCVFHPSVWSYIYDLTVVAVRFVIC